MGIYFKTSVPELGYAFWAPTKEQLDAILRRDSIKAFELGISLDLYLEAIHSPPIIK